MERNFKLILCYDGTRYRGWQRQGNTSDTIQAKLEALLSRLRRQLERSGIPVRDAGAEEGCVTLTVAPAQLLPALELCHRAVIQ